MTQKYNNWPLRYRQIQFLIFQCPIIKVHSTPITKKKYGEILLRYRRLFVKGDIFIGEWGIFGAEVFLCYSQFFVKGDFIIGRVECTLNHLLHTS